MPGDLVDEAARIGLDGVCLTEHSGGWEGQEFNRAFEDASVRFLRGLEVDTDAGHVIVFGLRSHVAGIHKLGDLRKAVTEANGVMIAAHPFRHLFDPPTPWSRNLLFGDRNGRGLSAREAARHPLFDLVDEIEVANGANTERESAFALEVASELGFRGTGGSDAHSVHGLGKAVTVFDNGIDSEEDLIEAIKARAFQPAVDFNMGSLRTLTC